MPRNAPPPVPTLAELHRDSAWAWATCRAIDCQHHVAMTFASWVIRFGPDASSDVMRERLACSKCGRRGALLTCPSFVDTAIGFRTFPVEKAWMPRR